MYKKASDGWFKHFDFILLDQLSLQLGFLIAFLMRQGAMNPYRMPLYRDTVIVLVFIQVFVVYFGDSFSGVLRRGYYREFVVTVKNDIMITLLVTFYLFAVQNAEDYSRITMFLTGIHYCWITYLVRIGWKRYLLEKNSRGGGARSLLILTSTDLMDSVINNIRSHRYEGYRLTGVALMDASRVGDAADGVSIVADQDTVVEYVRGEWVDEILVILPRTIYVPEETMNDFLKMGVTVHARLAETRNRKGRKQLLEEMGGYVVLTTSVNIASAGQLFLKRMMDLAGGLVGCLLTAVFLIFVGPAIYIQSPGPIFFSQVRVGRNGKRFKMYKFRSMYMDAEERKQELMKENKIPGGLMFKMDDDPRIIGGKRGIGGFIRRHSIDEFPQFFNVLRGDMSLVGTRPPTVNEWERYELHHRARLSVKPGITGMWQVSGRSGITDFEQVVQMDTEYIENWSLSLDIRILLRTVRSVLRGDGAC